MVIRGLCENEHSLGRLWFCGRGDGADSGARLVTACLRFPNYTMKMSQLQLGV